MRHLPHNTHCAEEFGVIHGNCALAGAGGALAFEIQIVAGAVVEERLVFHVFPVVMRFDGPFVPEVPISISPTVWSTVGLILGFKVLMH